MSKSKKRVNPRRQPVTMAEVKKAKAAATDNAIRLALYMVLYVLLDKRKMSKAEIKQTEHDVNYLADSIRRGDIDWKDIRSVLEDEYDVHLKIV